MGKCSCCRQDRATIVGCSCRGGKSHQCRRGIQPPAYAAAAPAAAGPMPASPSPMMPTPLIGAAGSTSIMLQIPLHMVTGQAVLTPMTGQWPAPRASRVGQQDKASTVTAPPVATTSPGASFPGMAMPTTQATVFPPPATSATASGTATATPMTPVPEEWEMPPHLPKHLPASAASSGLGCSIVADDPLLLAAPLTQQQLS